MRAIVRKTVGWGVLVAWVCGLLASGAPKTCSAAAEDAIGGRNWKACAASILLICTPGRTSAGTAMFSVFC